ncbi:YceI family protein [Aliarcobacter butzleri]|uniref:YceI family protein n=1 Tax=Aliarcobacter butzleri TaxID=28197 RepID=UPI0021B27FA5|nr:YceI family protein [Aliarcobacter butzleri]MCT7613196.1 YceI family protein [Aliarcobacter butzleri]MCT7641798.1 YceI family protein [Aliarcobacter butzleri]
MKKRILLSILVTFGLISSLNAYELNGNLGVKWTGFKLASKVGVSGTFNKIDLEITKSETLTEFLKSAKVKIESKSLESKDPVRNLNITSTLFSLANTEFIKGSISSVDEINKTLVLDVTMNKVTKTIPMSYEIENGNITVKGSIDILDFDMKSSYLAFTQKCSTLHENKSYSDVNIEFTIPFK